MIYGYARVSTAGQELEAQLQALKAEGAEVIYKEKVSAKNIKTRPELNKLLSILQEGDTLIVTRLDRLARSLIEGVKLVHDLFQRKIRLHILTIGVLEDTPVGNLFLNTLLAVAEFERSLIVERTQEGRELARKNPDYKEGRPKKFTKKQMDHAIGLLETHSFSQVADVTGISMSTLKRESSKRKKATMNNSQD